MIKLLGKLLIIIIFTNLAISCAPTKNAAYLSKSNKNGITNTPDQVYYSETEVADTIHINDELYISVTTGNDEANSFTQSMGNIGNNIELLSFIVDEEGYIKLPYIKRFNIAGLTIYESTRLIEEELAQYLYLPTVSIRIINHRFSVLGEVNSPGLYSFSQKSINIYQAIATANDISVFGNRKNVLIVRQHGNRITKKYVDLLDEDIITSQWYTIHPDDMIFVEPLGRKKLGMETVPYDLFFSIFSSTILVMTLLLSLFS